jgi:Cellulose biosynthesis protein BcsN
MKTRSLLFICLLPLAGCVSEPDPWLASGAAQPASPSAISGAGNRSVPPELAWARIGGIPDKPLSARSLTGEGTLIQQIVYSNRTASAGENMLTIEKGPASLGRVRKAPTRSAIVTEMRNVLPDIAMSVDGTVRSNAFGPYGVASGSLPGGGACVFAWQTIADWTDGAGKGKQSASIRLRYCDPSASRENLLNLLATLSPSGGIYRYTSAMIQPLRDPAMIDAVQQVKPAATTSKAGRIAIASTLSSKMEATAATTQPVRIPLPDI